MALPDIALETARRLADTRTGPEVKAFFDTDTFTVSYVVKDPASNACAIIDSVLDFDPASGRTRRLSADKIIDHVQREGLKVEWILETHAHADHLSAAPYLQSRFCRCRDRSRHLASASRNRSFSSSVISHQSRSPFSLRQARWLARW